MHDVIDNRKMICLDWNGVLDTYKGKWGEPTELRTGAEEFIKELYRSGYKITIFSSGNLADIDKILTNAGLSMYINLITNIKNPAIIYLDDRAITFNGEYDDALNAIRGFRAWWENDHDYEGSNIEELDDMR